ncbi:helix-turn-helix domain-containing protein [Candidatus Dojkabacteria bacterium]|uniref:Helix-turn-helix domain-containing protein n=1 Tax=Candidatus Dojkabacteria bacterium TaxID=2099670 RepID=A0A955L5C6_9BACT|nr:helix-turn-helix domain-containing protein [Candidatus Dojkabacteria bacterium]
MALKGKTTSITSWKYSLRTEAVRLIHTALYTYSGFYKRNNFIVVPYSVQDNHGSLVRMPHIKFQNIPRFWKRLESIDLEEFYKLPNSKLIDSVEQELIELELEIPKYSKLMEDWSKVESKFFETLYEILPNKHNIVTEVNIYPTVFGTPASFNVIPNGSQSNNVINMFIRDDQDIYKIAEAIVTAVTRRDVELKYEGLWRDSEIIVDWVVGETKIDNVLKEVVKVRKSKPTIANLTDKQMGNFLRISREFMGELGITFKEGQFQIEEGEVLYLNKKINNLSSQEKSVMRALVENSNRTVRLSEISEIMGYMPESYSLYAITKLIQRLRDKLDKSGISSGAIKTVRGEGYILNN